MNLSNPGGGITQTAADARYVLKAAGSFTGLTGAGFRDTNSGAGFDVTLGFTSSVALDAGRALTIDMGNVAHTIALGTTAGTITFPNAAALTVAGLQIANVWTAAQSISVNGAASTPALTATGTIFTGGTATTNKPHWLIEPTGTTSTNWSTAGTLFGGNAPSGFTGDLINLQLVAADRFKVASTGISTWFSPSVHYMRISNAPGTPALIGGFSSADRSALLLNSGIGYDAHLHSTSGYSTFGAGATMANPSANASMLGYATSHSQRTFTFGATKKDYNGAYTGDGHIVQLVGGLASAVTTGGAGGAVNITGGAAAGSGNNNGGAVNITGGALTGSGLRGAVNIASNSADYLGFYGVTAIVRAVLATGAGATVDNVITALQNLGLVKQS